MLLEEFSKGGEDLEVLALEINYDDSSEDASLTSGGKISPHSTPKIAPELRKPASRPLQTSRQHPRLSSGHVWLPVLLTIVIGAPAVAGLVVAAVALVRCLLRRHRWPEEKKNREAWILVVGRENWNERNDVSVSVIEFGGGPAEQYEPMLLNAVPGRPVLEMLSETAESS